MRALAEGHRLDQRLDDRRRLVSHDVRAEQLTGLRVGDESSRCRAVLHRPAVGDVAVVLDFADHVESLCIGFISVMPTEAICGSVNTAADTKRWSVASIAPVLSQSSSRLCRTTLVSWLATCFSS